MKIKFIITFLGCMMVAAAGLSGQTLLTDYGSADMQPFTVSYSDGTFSQGSNTATWSSSGLGQILRGTFTTVDLTAMGTPGTLELNLTFNSSFSGTIDYTIGSSVGNQLGYSYTGSGVTGTQTITFLRNASLDAGTINLSNVTRVSLTTSDPNFTLNTLSAVSAVPEPATYAALLGAASLGFVAWRRRRAA